MSDVGSIVIPSNLVCPDKYEYIYGKPTRNEVDHVPGWESYAQICMSMLEGTG